MDTDEIEKRRAQPWIPISNPRHLKYLGKLGEELGEATEAAACYLGNPRVETAVELEKELADVMANVELNATCFGWNIHPTTEAFSYDGYELIKVLGKAQGLLCRCVIQGMDGKVPETGEINSLLLENACFKLMCLIRSGQKEKLFDAAAMRERAERKKRFQLVWHEALPNEAAS